MARTKKNLRGGVAGDKRKRGEASKIDGESQKKKAKHTKDVVQAANILVGLRNTGEPEDDPMTGPVQSQGRDRPIPVPCPSNIMKYHLRADLAHDHTAKPFEDRKMAALYGGNEGGIQNTLDEKTAVEFIESNDVDAPDRDFRLKNRLTFKQDERTEMFPQHGGSAFRPFKDIDNSEIAVLQDAGGVLYRAIGAQNLLTFGSILDQAGKPASKEDDPIYFPASSSIEIDPCIYGFNPDALNKITISDFNGRRAKCVFNYKYDGKDETGGTGGILQINKRGGDFKSIEEVLKISELSKKFAGYIGKALGDITLVASLTPKIGNVENTFLPKANQRLQYLYAPERKIDIKGFLLNTGDQLNHVRAFMFGVDSVYSNKRGGVRKYEYIPGVQQTALSPKQTRDMYLDRIKKLIIQIDQAYGTFIKHLKTEIITNNEFNTNKSSKGGLILIPSPSLKRDEEKNKTKQRALEAILYIIDVVEVYRTFVLYYFLVFYKHFESITVTDQTYITDLKNTYEILLDKSTGLMPSATSTINSNGRDIRTFVSILKTDQLIFSNYEIQNTGSVIDYTNEYNSLFNTDVDNSNKIPKQTVDKLVNQLYNGRTVHEIKPEYYPISTLSNDELSKTHTFYVSDIYQLIGKNAPLKEPYLNIFKTFKFESRPDFSAIGGGDDSMIGGQLPDSIEVFAQTFNTPQESFDSIGVLTPPKEEYCSDLLIDFLKENTLEQLVGAVQTYKDNEYSIIDTLLLRNVYTDYKNARTALVQPDVDPEKDAYELAVPVLPEFTTGGQKDKHTKESLLFNAFACRYNGDLIRVDKPSDLEELLTKYAKQFEELAKLDIAPVKGAVGHLDEAKSSVFSRSNSQARSVDLSQASTASLNGSSGTASPFSFGSLSPIYNENKNSRRQTLFEQLPVTPPTSPIYGGGQRVPAENLYIDWTKSFVRRGGSSPNSEVK